MLCQLIALNSRYRRAAEHVRELRPQFDHWNEEGGLFIEKHSSHYYNTEEYAFLNIY